MIKFSKSSAALSSYVSKNSLPPFNTIVFKLKKMDKVDGPDADKTQWLKLEFFMDTDSLASK
jgi:hypothetical protein